LSVCGFDEDSAAEGVGGDQADNRARGSGAVYVLERSGATWRQDAYVKASNTTVQGAFGTAIALSADGNTMAICACDEDGLNPGVGAAQWQADIPAPERTRAVDGSAGAVYVYRREGPTWVFDTYIKSSNIGPNDIFGSRLALSADGTVLAAGAPQERGGGSGINPLIVDTSAPESGAVYLFERTAQGWRQAAYVKATDATEYDSFGSGVALNGDGDLLAAAAPGADGSTGDPIDAGAVYLFTRSQRR
ncbi:MAG: FG-GAP repeat protein, partial [Gammaproteobacteria bacterium]|nr:FG-GAP repeat protein [Gammaproteobacteria bacterium]